MLSAWSDFQGVRVRGMHGHVANMARRTIRSHAILSVAVESHSSVSATYPPAFVKPFPLRRLHRVPSASSHRMRLGSSTADWRSRNPPAPGGLDNLHLLFASAQKRGNVQFEGLGGADRDEGHAIEHIRMPIRRIRSASPPNCCKSRSVFCTSWSPRPLRWAFSSIPTIRGHGPMRSACSQPRVSLASKLTS